jgi:signal transduction histidine kinase
VYVGPTFSGIIFRLIVGHWWLAWIFFIAGWYLFWRIQPQDRLHQLLTAYFWLHAIMIIISTLTWWNIHNASLTMNSLLWLIAPVAIQLHWRLPRPLSKPNGYFNLIIYALGINFALLNLTGNPTVNFLAPAVWGLSFFMSVVLLVIRFWLQPDQQRRVSLLLISIGMPALILIGYVIPYKLVYGSTALFAAFTAFVSLGFLPETYLNVAYPYNSISQRNSNAIKALFGLMMLGILILPSLLLERYVRIEFFSSPVIVLIIVTPSVILFTINNFEGFKHWVEKAIFRIPLPFSTLTETYRAHLKRVSQLSELAELLQQEVLPSLHLQQSALFIEQQGQFRIVYTQGILATQLPHFKDYSELLNQSDKYRNLLIPLESSFLPWVKLILPLDLQDNQWGFWLFGQLTDNAPYSPIDIQALKNISSTTAATISAINRTEELRLVLRKSMEREEEHGNELAHEIHEITLAALKRLQQEMALVETPPKIKEVLAEINANLRGMMIRLNPPLLEQDGLPGGIKEIVAHLEDETAEQETEIENSVTVTGARLETGIARHLYRIILQAGENAVEHAHASVITISGNIDGEQVELCVADNGTGFVIDPKATASELMKQGSYGLAYMKERTQSIGGNLEIESSPNNGTRVFLAWHKTNLERGTPPAPHPLPARRARKAAAFR